jgi:glycine/D-amino acid oxidase-like deaminating enzyme
MSIAILGAGLTGCGAALELAERGERVVLFERRERPMPETSRWNEGKLHLGLIFANDPSGRTAIQLIDAAIAFSRVLSRWVDLGDWQRLVSPPMEYCVASDSLLSVGEIEAHFRKVEKHLLERSGSSAGGYPLWEGEPLFERAAIEGAGYDPERVAARFVTRERCVDTFAVASAIEAAVLAHPRIEFRPQATVLSVRDSGANAFEVRFRRDREHGEIGFTAVINALWANRMLVDARHGAVPVQRWMNRFKVGVHAVSDPETAGLPTVTFMLGPYGDTVQYPSGRFYFTWYPSAMFGWSDHAEYIDWERRLAGIDKSAVAEEMIGGLSSFIPACKSQLKSAGKDWIVDGGPIFAWGESDIDDVHSRLHQRHEIGIHQDGKYLSIDTGKYTCGPLFALEAAERISPRRASFSFG